MDPNATLSLIYARMADVRQPTDGDDPLEAALELVDALEALDDWIRCGGMLPREWDDEA